MKDNEKLRISPRVKKIKKKKKTMKILGLGFPLGTNAKTKIYKGHY